MPIKFIIFSVINKRNENKYYQNKKITNSNDNSKKNKYLKKMKTPRSTYVSKLNFSADRPRN